MGKESSNIYFAGLNGLRFYAASAVIFHHCEQFKYWEGIPSYWDTGNWKGVFIDSLGHQAVGLFFVLSGFLITYLLLVEISKTGNVSLRKFYIRRTLRIWPVYYLVVLIAFFILPKFTNIGDWAEPFNEKFNMALILYLVVLPNVMRGGSVQVIGANQAWSVGVEEQFYIVWPVLVRLFHKKFIEFIISFISIKMIIQVVLLFGSNYLEDVYWQKIFVRLYYIWSLLAIEQMAIGAIGAWLLYKHKESWLKWIYSPVVQFLAIAVFVSLFIFDYEFIGKSILAAVSFIILILNISTNKNFFIKLKHKNYDALGNMSYGIYMYHTICISITITVLKNLNLTTNLLAFNLALYGFSFLLTILMSFFSYRYFESFFLVLKKKFMVILSSSKSDT